MRAVTVVALASLALSSSHLFAQQTPFSDMPLGASIFKAAFTPKVTRYELTITDTTYAFTGQVRKGYAVNGRSPMPTLEFTEGDTALIIVHNAMAKEETSLHWHGIILPNRFDGVPYLTTPPIKAGETQEYRFPLLQSGTYWYHSHTNLQEQNGMHGAFIIHEREEEPLPEYTVILSEWTDMKPNEVHRRLHNANDWFAIQKNKLRPGTTQSYWDAIREGQVGSKLTNEWKRMRSMDVSDVYYDTFLTNGKEEDEAPRFKAGDRVRVRLINGGASTYFWINYAGGKMTVVASDGMVVEPVEVDRFIMGVAETYDIIVTIPADSTAYELLASSEDRTRSTSLWLGAGIRQLATPLGALKYFEGMKMMNGMMRMNGDMEDMGMNMALQRMDMNTVMYPEITGNTPAKPQVAMVGMGHQQIDACASLVTLNYGMLRSPSTTALPAGPMKELRFELTGNMNRYLWSIDNKTVTETDKIIIHKGENVRIILYNNSMMRHPMHLHGHFFRVLNGQGDHSPLKNVLDIMPMETDTIEFAGTEDGDWFFHCHILYHMMSGMGRVFSYERPAAKESPYTTGISWKQFARDDKRWHFMFMNDFATNGNDGELMLQSKRWALSSDWHLGYKAHHGWEFETHLGRYLGRMQWWFPYIGYDWRDRNMPQDAMAEDDRNFFDQPGTKDHRSALCLGIQYTLPMLFVFDARVDSDARLRAQLMRDDIPLSARARLDLMGNSDGEYMARARYILTKEFAATVHYDSDMGLGVGVTLSY